MFKFVIVLTTLVCCSNALGVVPLELGSRFIESSSRKVPSTSIYYLLPRDTVPIRYDVEIATDIAKGNFSFSGNVKIYLKAASAVNQITIHQRQLTIKNTKLIAVEYLNNEYTDLGVELPLSTLRYNETTEFLTVPLNGVILTKDQIYKLEINYDGVLRGSKAGSGQSDAGFYRSSYTNANNQVRWLATTQFESTDARHGFPCYDEPALKAKFNIKLKYDSSYSAISNMPVKNEDNVGGYKTTTFDETPIMSTYLIAFVVSDFQYVANLREPITDKTKVLHRVFGTPARQNELNFTLEAGVKILDALDKYLNVSYIATVPKMDQIGIPDFAAGAMENWGLVTYAESAFYYSPTSVHNQKDRIAKIVAHEFAHQWFGNLVSPEWWKYIWLNEGFATVFEYYIPNIVYPEYRSLDYFTIQVCHRVLVTDSSSDQRPMTFDAYSPSEISSLFDSIAYDKSGCVITMIMHAVGEPAFQAGLTKYLTERKEKEANPDHLFTAIQSEAVLKGTIPSGLTVNSVFGKWSTQRGYPVINVLFNTTSKIITLKQEAFLVDSLTDSTNLIWTIPYNYVTNEELNQSVNADTTTQDWLSTSTQALIPGAARNWTNANFVLFNKKLTGYYRVNYNIENWNAIISYVAKSEDAMKIHELNRAQLLGDAMNIARANRLSYSIPLELARNLMKHETSFFTWSPFISDFNYIEQTLFDSSSYSKLLKWAIEVGTTAYNFYTVKENAASDTYYGIMTRNSLVNYMCRVGFTKCHDDTHNALLTYLDGKLVVSSYLKAAILQNGLRAANTTTFLTVWKSIMGTQTDRSIFLPGLGLSNSDENIQNLLGSVLTETNATFADVKINYSASERNTILTTVASSKVKGFKRVLELLKAEAVAVKKIFGNNIVTVFSTLAARTSTSATLTQLDELMIIYKDNDVNKRFAGYIETAVKNVQWNLAAGATIKAPLDNIYKDEGSGASTMVISTVLVAVALMFSRFMV